MPKSYFLSLRAWENFDMSIRDKFSKPSVYENPVWLNNASDTTKVLYQSALCEFLRIKHVISMGGVISLKDRKINQSTVAKDAKKDKSILSARRQPELMEWINQKNVELSHLLENHAPRKVKPSSTAYLKSELSKLKAVNNTAVLDGLRSFVETILSSNVLHDHDTLARENIKLKNKIDTLHKQIVNLQDRCNQQAAQIASLKNSSSKALLTLVPDARGDD